MKTFRCRAFARIRQRGVSLIEAMTVVAVGAIVTAGALPSFESARLQRAIGGAASVLETDLQFARSEALARQQALRFTVGQNGGATCYLLHTGGADDCRCDADGSARCTAGVEVLRHQGYTAADRVQVLANVGGLWLEPLRGAVTPAATFRVVGADGRALHQVVSAMGRIRSCTPDGRLPGVRSC